MQLQDISQFRRDWNFSPRQNFLDVMPAWAVDGYLISGFELESPHPVHALTDLSAEKANDLFFALYPKISWPELARFAKTQTSSQKFNIVELGEKYGMRWDSVTQRLSENLIQWPREVQEYIIQKDIRPTEARILSEISTEVQSALMLKLISSQPTKSIFCQCLELSCELIMMGQNVPEVLQDLQNPKALELFKAQRFPVSSANDQRFSAAIKNWNVPKGVTVQAMRRGDIQGIDIKFFAKSSEELIKTLKALESLPVKWKEFENESNSTF